MASKKRTTNLPRFRVESIEGRFAIFDSAAWTYTLCAPRTSRSLAEHEAGQLNGTLLPEREQAKHVAVRRQLLASFPDDSPDVLVGTDGRYRIVHNYTESPASVQRRNLIANYKIWLSLLMRDWAATVAAQRGYGPDRRGMWWTWEIIQWLRANKIHQLAPGTELRLRELHRCVFPFLYRVKTDGSFQRRVAVALHYLSTDPASLKAGYLGMSKASYLRYVDDGHRLVAERWFAWKTRTLGKCRETPGMPIFKGFEQISVEVRRGVKIAMCYFGFDNFRLSDGAHVAPFSIVAAGGTITMDRRLIEALAANAMALDRLRRAAYGLDSLDRLEVAERLAAKRNARVKSKVRDRTRSRNAARSA